MSMGAAPNLAGGLAVVAAGGWGRNLQQSYDAASPPPSCCQPGDPSCGGGGGGGNGGGGCPTDGSGGGGGPTPMDVGNGSSCGCGSNGSGTGGGGDGGPIPMAAALTRTQAHYASLPSSAPDCNCPSGNCPPPPPGSGSPISQQVECTVGSLGPNVQWLLITCAETGVTQASVCGTVTFYHDTGGVKHYTSAAGRGQECVSGGPIFQWNAGSGQGVVTMPVQILVTQA